MECAGVTLAIAQSTAALQPVFDSCQSGSAVRFSQIRFLYLKIFASTAVADARPNENNKNASAPGTYLSLNHVMPRHLCLSSIV